MQRLTKKWDLVYPNLRMMNRVARALLGSVTGLLIVGLGINLFSWQFWVLATWFLAHSMIWSLLDKKYE